MFVWIILFVSPMIAHDIDIPFTKYVLDNGLTLIVHQDKKAPIVAVNIWYHVGSKNESPGKTGFAHLFEHLMFKATRRRASGEFSKIVARNGGRDNAFTSQDYTAYHQTVARDRLEIVMRLEADRMRGLLLRSMERNISSSGSERETEIVEK